MLRWMRYLWIVSRQFTAKVFAHRLVLTQKLVMVSFQSEITEVPAGCDITESWHTTLLENLPIVTSLSLSHSELLDVNRL